MATKNIQLLDADGVAYFSRQLEAVKARTLEIKYPELTFRKVFPVDNSVSPGATSVVVQHYGMAGKAKVVNGSAKDIPRVDISGGETIYPVKMVADSFGYTIKEIQSAKMAGIPIDQKKANAARHFVEAKLNDIAYNGDATNNLTGLFSDANVPQGDAPNGSWASATADDIVEDVVDALTQVYTDSNGVEIPDSLLVTPEAYALLTTKQRSTASDKTVFAWLIENVPYFNRNPQSIIACPECIEAGDESADVIVALARNAEKLEMCIPEEINFTPEQLDGLEYMIAAYAQTAGLHIYYPGSIFISEGV